MMMRFGVDYQYCFSSGRYILNGLDGTVVVVVDDDVYGAGRRRLQWLIRRCLMMRGEGPGIARYGNID